MRNCKPHFIHILLIFLLFSFSYSTSHEPSVTDSTNDGAGESAGGGATLGGRKIGAAVSGGASGGGEIKGNVGGEIKGNAGGDANASGDTSATLGGRKIGVEAKGGASGSISGDAEIKGKAGGDATTGDSGGGEANGNVGGDVSASGGGSGEANGSVGGDGNAGGSGGGEANGSAGGDGSGDGEANGSAAGGDGNVGGSGGGETNGSVGGDGKAGGGGGGEANGSSDGNADGSGGGETNGSSDGNAGGSGGGEANDSGDSNAGGSGGGEVNGNAGGDGDATASGGGGEANNNVGGDATANGSGGGEANGNADGDATASGGASGSGGGNGGADGSGAGSVNGQIQKTFSKVFAFGDSYTDTGNCKILGGLQSFAGAFLKKIGNRSPLLGMINPDGNGLSNGRLVIDFLCENLNLPPLPAFKNTTADFSHGANFAIAGSTSLTAKFLENLKTAQPLMWKGIPQTIQTQIDWFNDFKAVARKDPNEPPNAGEEDGGYDDSLFWIGELGGNDYARIFGTQVSGTWLANESVKHVTNLLQDLLNKGAKYILIQGLPPMGCLPSHLSMCPKNDRDEHGCAKSTNDMIKVHNDLLLKKVEEFRARTEGKCTVMFADYWKAFMTILQEHDKLGLTEPFKACCGAQGEGLFNFKLKLLCGALGTSACEDQDKYINWDGVHLTEAMHGKLADLFFNQEGFVTPSLTEVISKKGEIKVEMAKMAGSKVTAGNIAENDGNK